MRNALHELATARGRADVSDALVRLVEERRLLAGSAGRQLGQLLDALEASPEQAAAVAGALERILLETDGTALFGETGVPSDQGFLAELSDRAWAHLLPAPRDDRELSHLFERLFGTAADVERFTALPPEVFHRLASFLAARLGSEAWERLRAGFADGFRLALVRLESEGLARSLRARSTPRPVSESPFHRIVAAGEALLVAWRGSGDVEVAAAAFREASAACREEMDVIRRHMAAAGVSVEVVFGLEVIERCLVRSAVMAEIMEAPPGPARSRAVHALLSRLAFLAHRDRSVAYLLKWNLHLLDRRIVDRSGATGEHYVARNRAEWKHIWVAAAGGGLLTVFTAAAKMAVHDWHLAPFPESFLYGVNYAASFLLMQALGLMLATKQPAMTAAALAAIMRDSRGEDREERIAAFFSRLVGSQLAAAAANVLAVALGSMAFSALFALAAGRTYLAHDEARATFDSLSPLDSGTLFFAALTGVLLWIGSLAGGWFENWTAYHRLPEAVAAHPLRRRLGPERTKRLAAALERNAAGWGTNVALGFLLGFAPAVGRFFGIPFDVRHVTLSTGTLALAAESLGKDWFGGGAFLRATAGIGTMFVLNLSVSFALSLFNAARAYEMTTAELLGVMRRVLARAVRRPLTFLRPPAGDAVPG